jgi:hypothetical protein
MCLTESVGFPPAVVASVKGLYPRSAGQIINGGVVTARYVYVITEKKIFKVNAGTVT